MPALIFEIGMANGSRYHLAFKEGTSRQEAMQALSSSIGMGIVLETCNPVGKLDPHRKVHVNAAHIVSIAFDVRHDPEEKVNGNG